MKLSWPSESPSSSKVQSRNKKSWWMHFSAVFRVESPTPPSSAEYFCQHRNRFDRSTWHVPPLAGPRYSTRLPPLPCCPSLIQRAPASSIFGYYSIESSMRLYRSSAVLVGDLALTPLRLTTEPRGQTRTLPSGRHGLSALRRSCSRGISF